MAAARQWKVKSAAPGTPENRTATREAFPGTTATPRSKSGRRSAECSDGRGLSNGKKAFTVMIQCPYRKVYPLE
jgi:hypothetical protein